MLRKARLWGYLSSIPEFHLFREHNRIRYLSEMEEAALLAQCKGELRAFTIFVLNTALRPGEAKRLKWEHVEADSMVVKGKGGKYRRVPLNKNAREALATLQKKSEYVFHALRNSLASRFRKAVASSKLDTKGENRVTPHTLRHTAISRMAHRGADVASLQKLAGHSSIIRLRGICIVGICGQRSSCWNFQRRNPTLRP